MQKSSVQQTLQNIKPVQIKNRSNRTIFDFKDLSTCLQVYIRNDTIKEVWKPPYSGPHLVINRQEKHFLVKINNIKKLISKDR